MKGDFSRLTGRKAERKHFDAVLKQQGRVQLDSDWNELISIIEHQRKVRTIDIIGQFGAPLHNSGFQILHPGGMFQDLLISTGRFYAEGLLCETTPSSKLPIKGFLSSNRVSVDDVKIDGVSLKAGDWVQVITDETPDGIIAKIANINSNWIETDQNLTPLIGENNPCLRLLLLYSAQADFPGSGSFTPIQGQTHLIYLDVWQRHITTVEDPELREVALGGPDTDTRTKVIAQVKALPVQGNYNCADLIEEWESFLTQHSSNGRLTTLMDPPDLPDNPCELGESGGFHGLENRLYRVEIHDVDTSGNATFKWSRDNAAFAYAIEDFFVETGGTVFKIRLKQNGKDNVLKIKEQDWIEISGDKTDLNYSGSGTLARVILVEGDIFTLDTDVSAHKDETHPKVRRWDTSSLQPNVLNGVTGVEIPLEDGIKLKFSGTVFLPGEYWVFEARTLTGLIEILDREPPLGIKHHYCKLALVTCIDPNNIEIEDCRPEFPPLTEISGGCCTVTVGRNEAFRDIQQAVDSLKGGPGTVCVKPGIYIIDKPIVVDGANNITIKGCEGKPFIINTSSRSSDTAVFQVTGSWDVHIHDFYCLSYGGDRVVEVENSLWFNLNDCILIGAGAANSDISPGIVTCQGFILNSVISDNLMLGRVGLRYTDVTEQQINLHLIAQAERNIIIALENGVLQEEDTVLAAFDLGNNVMIGFGLQLLGRAFLPESLFQAAKKANLYSAQDMAKAEATRNKGQEFESVNHKNAMPLLKLEQTLRIEADKASYSSRSMKYHAAVAVVETTEVEQLTLNPVAAFSGTLIDANITDNIMIGAAGILTHTSMETVIDKNIVFVGQRGASLGNSIGVTLQNNFIVSGADAVGFYGSLSMGLTLTNNVIMSQGYGFFADYLKNNAKLQIAYNIQVDKNLISAKKAGVFLVGSVLFLWDLTITDNSVTEMTEAGIAVYGFSEQLSVLERTLALQRVIQNNSVMGSGVGIYVGIPSCEILDNVINISAGLQPVNSRGIMLTSARCTIANNSIQAINFSQQNFSLGGIYIDIYQKREVAEYHQIDIRNNTITGGAQNGIEIASDLNGLTIEGNEISGVGLNGIAVQSQVRQVDNLRIASNHIHNCQINLSRGAWWRFAGIVLTNTRKAQILDNVIADNVAQNLAGAALETGAFYAERINEIIISGNQFTNNGPAQGVLSQAVIHVPVAFGFNDANSDIQIVNNLVKSNVAPALILGNYVCFILNNNNNWTRAGFRLAAEAAVLLHCFAFDSKAVISNNHFESLLPGPIVMLHVNNCVFSSNIVNAASSQNSVYLGYGMYVMANGNVISDPIIGANINQVIINNLQF